MEFAINGHLSVRELIFASADGPDLIQSLPAIQNGSCKCEQYCLQIDLRCLQAFLARLQVRATVYQIELPLHYIFKILRHGLRDDLRAIHPYTLFLMYTYSLSAGCFGPQEHTHDLLYQDFSNSLVCFGDAWGAQRDRHQITIRNVVNALVTAKRHMDWVLS